MGEIASAIGGAVGDVTDGLVGGMAKPFENQFQAANPASAEMLNQANMQTQTGLTGQQNLAQALAQQGGLANQQKTLGQQQNLADILYQQSLGGGPNPAQAALNQQTSNNINQQSAMMAGQRGAGANAGMIARQAALQGGNLQQQAVGQGATLQAQQQLAAQQHLMAQQQAMQQVAGNQISNQMGSQNAFTQGALQNQGNMLGANNASNQINAGVASSNAAMRQGMMGGLLGGAGSMLTKGLGGGAAGGAAAGGGTAMAGGAEAAGGSDAALMMLAYKGGVIDPHHMEMAKIYHPQFAQGGMVENPKLARVPEGDRFPGQKLYHSPHFDDGGQVQKPTPTPEPSLWDTVKSSFQEEPKSKKPDKHPLNQDKANAFMASGHFDKGGKVPVMLSPGEKKISPQEAQQVASGKKSIADAGNIVPGKPKVKGDSLKNDVVPDKMEEGGIVIPNSVMNSKDPVKEGTKFLVEALKKHGGAKEHGDFKDALKKAIASRSK